MGAVAAILAAPIAIAEWFMSARWKTNTARVGGAGMGILGDVRAGNGSVATGHQSQSGDVSARDGGVAIGHNVQIVLATAHVPPQPEQRFSSRGRTDIIDFQIKSR